MIISMKLMLRFILLAFVFVASPVSAQLNTEFLGAQTELKAEPEFPQPGEKVKVSFANYGSQYHNADIVWRVNNEIVADANNRREVEYTAGDLGQADVVTASIVRNSGATQTFGMRVVPTYVDIVLEPQTRVPDFYQGRALPSVGSQINATVLVNNGEILTGNYIYTWLVNGKVLNGGPIRGTNQVSFDTPQGSRTTISVEVIDLEGNVVGRRSIYFLSSKPELVYYETNALHGQSHTAIAKTLLLIGDTATIVAEPYYLDIRTYNNPDIIEWEIDRVLQENTNPNPYTVTLQGVNEAGQSKVSFHVRSTSQLLQGAEKSINVSF